MRFDNIYEQPQNIPHSQLFDLLDLAEDACELVENLAVSQKIPLLISTHNTYHYSVTNCYGDYPALKQVVMHLISHAICCNVHVDDTNKFPHHVSCLSPNIIPLYRPGAVYVIVDGYEHFATITIRTHTIREDNHLLPENCLPDCDYHVLQSHQIGLQYSRRGREISYIMTFRY